MIAKQPEKTYRLGDPLPAIPVPVASWPWPGSPALTKWSVDMLKYPLGTLIYDVVDGHPVLAQIQTHSWYGAHPDWPATPHKGTSVYVPTTVNASGKRVAISDPPDGWGEPSTVAGMADPAPPCAPGDPLCTDLPDESAPPPAKKLPMNTVFLNGRPVSGFGVGENFCPTLPYNCPPRPWGPDEGPNVSIADRLGTGDGDTELKPFSQKVVEKIASVAIGAMTVGALGAGVGTGISYMNTKKVRGATVGQGALAGAALGGALGLVADFTVRKTNTVAS